MKNGSVQNQSAQGKTVQMRVSADLNYGRGESRFKTWEVKLPEAGASLDVRVSERKEAIRPLIRGRSWQLSEG